MNIDKDRFTKLETKELRVLTDLACERELAHALESIEDKFRQWREHKITVFELSDFIHQFHNCISCELWSFYTSGYDKLVVSQAIDNGIILKTEVSKRILEKLK